MNSLNFRVPVATGKGAPQSSPQWEQAAASPAVLMAAFAREAPQRRTGSRAVAMIAAVGVQVGLLAALMHGTFDSPPPAAPPPLQVNILPETTEPPPPPPPPLKPTLVAPVLVMNMPQAPQIYEPPPVVAMPPSPNAIATSPTPVSLGDPQAAVRDFQIKLLKHLHRHKRYPASARAKREQGVVYVRFAMDRSGNVLSAALEKRGRWADLDAEGVALLTRAQPLPIPPREVTGDPIEMIVPVEFSLK
jgi:periplasmic protein TonB